MGNAMYLPLHHGKAPYWLLGRMKKLAKPIISLIIEEFGEKEFFRRISNPIFFQSLSNVLGFDWNSSGSTTVLTGVLKSVLNTPESDIRIAGGKGKEGRKTPEHIVKFAEELNISEPNELIKISRLSAKIDNVALQDGYSIYHHTLIFSKRYWTVVQQGLNESKRLARRYHWSFETGVPVLKESIHSGIVSERKEKEVINLVADSSRECRETTIDIVRDGSFKRDYSRLITITKYRDGISVPRRVNWSALEKAYNLQIENFEELLLLEGIGIGAIRALTLISDLIYNVEYEKEDPAKYCFALGGKDGIPFPVDRKAYDEVIAFMEDVVGQSKLSNFDKKEALRRLSPSIS